MLETHNLSLFLLTAVMLILLPGPSTLYILGRSISQGCRAGVMSVLGIGTGTLCHTVAVAFGLSVLLVASQPVFLLLKYAGAAYLVYLGIQTLRRPPMGTTPEAPAPQMRLRTIYVQGWLTQMLNPKVSLFFVALLPQFVAPHAAHSPLPFLFLGILFVTLDTLWFLTVATGSARLTYWLRRSMRLQQGMKWASGLLYIGLGLNLLRLRARLAS